MILFISFFFRVFRAMGLQSKIYKAAQATFTPSNSNQIHLDQPGLQCCQPKNHKFNSRLYFQSTRWPRMLYLIRSSSILVIKIFFICSNPKIFIHEKEIFHLIYYLKVVKCRKYRLHTSQKEYIKHSKELQILVHHISVSIYFLKLELQ